MPNLTSRKKSIDFCFLNLSRALSKSYFTSSEPQTESTTHRQSIDNAQQLTASNIPVEQYYCYACSVVIDDGKGYQAAAAAPGKD